MNMTTSTRRAGDITIVDVSGRIVLCLAKRVHQCVSVQPSHPRRASGTKC